MCRRATFGRHYRVSRHLFAAATIAKCLTAAWFKALKDLVLAA